MDRKTLSAVRQRIETLATADGEYYVVCGRTGQRPVPVEGLTFPDRKTAREAAQTATAYRALLREYDPDTPVYDFIACQHHGATAGATVGERPSQQEGDV